MKNYPLLLALLISIPAYIVLSYFTLRTDIFSLLMCYLAPFAFFAIAYKCANSDSDVKLAACAGIFFRLLLLFSFPNLSDDIYRFYWDGLLCVNGIPPFQYLPSEFITGSMQSVNIPGINEKLFGLLNSPEYYTIYPPVCQWIFAASAKIFPNSIEGATVFMKLILLLFEMGTIGILFAMSKLMGYTSKYVLLYALNPLVIVELIGNVHFEAAMIFFLLAGIYLLVVGRWTLSALSLALSICSKLLPLMLLPFFIRRLGWRKSIPYFLILGIATVILFMPFLSVEIIGNFFASVNLYFGKFEFNSSAYRLIYTAGAWFTGEATYSLASKIGAISTFLFIIFMAWREPDLSTDSLLRQLVGAMGVYFLFTSTVHPWYLSTLVALSAFSCFRFPILWSGLIILTYCTYMQTPYQQVQWINGFEYIAVIAFLLIENYQYLKSTALKRLRRKHLEASCGMNDLRVESSDRPPCL